jgi:hypothetical protein
MCVLGDFGPLALENRASLLPDSFDLLAEQASHSSTSRRCGPHVQLYCTKQYWNRHRGSIPLFSDLDMVILWIHVTSLECLKRNHAIDSARNVLPQAA